jgi:TRAP-type uncharacterized transport system substrate-binding protein
LSTKDLTLWDFRRREKKKSSGNNPARCRSNACAATRRQDPLNIPLHPAAERFWRERGYLA